jgi:YwiC-like protein
VVPREHGAYGQLLFPMGTALAIGRPGTAALAWAGAAVLAFLAHEPVIVLLGQRGATASRDERHRARRWLGCYLTGVALLGSFAVARMPDDARLTLFVPLSLGALLAMVIGVRREHTPVGEVLSAIVMASLAWPAAIASGVPPVAASTCAVVFAGGYAAATLAVHAVIARTRQPPAIRARITAMLTAVVIVVLVGTAAQMHVLDRAAAVAVAPMLCGAIVLAWAAPPAGRLRTVGWTLIAVSTATAGIAIALLRT